MIAKQKVWFLSLLNTIIDNKEYYNAGHIPTKVGKKPVSLIWFLWKSQHSLWPESESRGQSFHHHFTRLQAPCNQAFVGLFALFADINHVPIMVPNTYSIVRKYKVCEWIQFFEHLVEKMSMVVMINTFKLVSNSHKVIRWQQNTTSLICKWKIGMF